MPKEKNIDDKNINETSADRLNAVIIKYFRTQIEVAELLGITSANLNNYIAKRNNITLKFAMLLQNKTGINASYILNGDDAPMMTDAKRKPVFEGDVPSVSKLDTKTLHGIAKQYILENTGEQQTLKDNGEPSVVNLVLGNLEEKPTPFMILNILPDFEEEYDIPMGAILILKKD